MVPLLQSVILISYCGLWNKISVKVGRENAWLRTDARDDRGAYINLRFNCIILLHMCKCSMFGQFRRNFPQIFSQRNPWIYIRRKEMFLLTL